MAISTAITTLAYETGTPGTFTKLVDIVTYPDTGSAPSKLDSTTLSATKMKTFILGLQESPDLTFECNYDEASYTIILAMNGTAKNFKLSFGTLATTTLNGADGYFTWTGKVSIFATGGGVDEVRKMTLTLSAETEIVFNATA